MTWPIFLFKKIILKKKKNPLPTPAIDCTVPNVTQGAHKPSCIIFSSAPPGEWLPLACNYDPPGNLIRLISSDE